MSQRVKDTKSNSHHYDVIVIGAGTGGLVAADFAAKLGARTALVERERIGGDCTWAGCVPSKALIRAARAAHEARNGARFGVYTSQTQVDLGAVKAYIHNCIEAIYQYETPEALRAKGFDPILGHARFTDPHTVEIDGVPYTAKHFILATGAEPITPRVDGIDGVPYHTYKTIFENDRLPERMIVMGSGPIGCEIGQAYSRLGAKVTLLGDRLLPKDEPEAGEALEKAFYKEGITRAHGEAVAAWMEDQTIVIRAREKNGAENVLRADMLMVAAGRAPNVAGLNLEAAGVAYSEDGIGVDKTLRTNVDHIYAVGDCTGGYQFTHYAGWQGFTAVRNALLPLSSDGIDDNVPWATFTDPVVAHVGLNEASARERFGDGVHVERVLAERIDRAVVEDQPESFIKVIFKTDGTLLGATIVGIGAGEAIAEYALAIHHKMKAGDMARAFHVYPTYSTATQLIASDMTSDALLNGLTGKLLKAIVR